MTDHLIRIGSQHPEGNIILGKMLRDTRMSKELTVSTLARRVGITGAMIRSCENGHRGYALDTLVNVLDRLGEKYTLSEAGVVWKEHRIIPQSSSQRQRNVAEDITGYIQILDWR